MSYFSPSGSAGLTPSVSVVGASTPTVVLVTLTSASTEYSVIVPTNCKQYVLKARGLASLQVSYTAGQSGINYLTVPRGCFYAESDLNLTASVTIYMQSPSSSQIVELIYWT